MPLGISKGFKLKKSRPNSLVVRYTTEDDAPLKTSIVSRSSSAPRNTAPRPKAKRSREKVADRKARALRLLDGLRELYPNVDLMGEDRIVVDHRHNAIREETLGLLRGGHRGAEEQGCKGEEPAEPHRAAW